MEASEGKSLSESMVSFLGVRNYTVGSIDLRAVKILRCDCATFRLDAPLEGKISRVTGVVNLLLIQTTAVAISMVFCVLVGVSWSVLL